MPDSYRRGDGGRGAVLLMIGLLLVLVAAVLLIANEAPTRLGGLAGAGRGMLQRMIPRPFPSPERRVQPAPASAAGQAVSIRATAPLMRAGWVSFIADMARMPMPAAAIMYHAGAIGLPDARIIQVTEGWAIPPNTATPTA